MKTPSTEHTKKSNLFRKIILLTLIIVYLISNASSVSLAYKISVLNNNAIETSVTEDDGIFACADNSTVDSYKDIVINPEQGGRYDGRIWADKSVYAHNEQPEVTLDDRFNINYNEDFLHVFSVLGSNQIVKTPNVLDVMFVIDLSGSQGARIDTLTDKTYALNEDEFSETQIVKTVEILNDTVDKILNLNNNSRIGVSIYGATAALLLPLDNYSKFNDEPIFSTEYIETYGAKPQGVHFKFNIKAQKDGEVIERYSDNSGQTSNDYYNKSGDGNRVCNGTSGHTGGSGTKEAPFHVGHLTNQQAGIVAGLENLATSKNTIWVSSTGENRSNIPCMIHLTDGQASDIATLENSSNWYKPNIDVDIAYSSKITNAEPGSDNEYNASQLTGNTSPQVVIFQTLMSASYYTIKVNNHYIEEAQKAKAQNISNVSFTNYAIYSSNKSSEEMKDEKIKTTIEAICDPTNYFNEENISKYITGTKEDSDADGAYELFKKWKNGETVFVEEIDTSTGSKIKINLETNKFQLDNDPYGITADDVIENINYIKSRNFFKANTSTLKDELEKIIEMENTKVTNPIGDSENEAGAKNALSYVDPIGKYMEIKNVNKLLLFGKEYNIIKDGNIQTETVGGQTVQKQYYKAVGGNNQDLIIENITYGNNITFKLSEIKIWREISNDYDTGEGREIDTAFDEALHVTIPKNAIPILLDTIEYDGDNKIINYTRNAGKDETLPLRIVYEVGISEDIINENGMIDLSRLSQEYFVEHKKEIAGKEYVEFLSNYYSKENYDKKVNNTFGNAAVTFKPSETNHFYIFQKNLIIYQNSTGGDINGEGELEETGRGVVLTDEVKNLSDIEKDKTYYFAIDYYAPYDGADGSKGRVVKYAVAYKGSDFYGKNDECYLALYDKEKKEEVEVANENTVVATKVGGRRTSRIERLAVNKTENKTETSTMVSAPRYGGPLSEDSIVDYLGNNGRLAVSATWLFVNKVVNANVDKSHFYEPTNEEFEFELYLDKNIGTENAIVYEVYSWNGETWIPKKDKTYVITDNKGYILFSDGRSSSYWVGNSEAERLVNEDGTITVYDSENKTVNETIQVFTDENQLESLYKITAVLETKKLEFELTGNETEIKTTFTLKDGEGLLLSGLLPETKWRVTENLTQDQLDRNFAFESITGRENDEITINERTISGKTEAGLTDEANYRNNFTQYFKGLTIEKNVSGRVGDKEREWEFEVKLTPKEDVILYDEYEYEGGSFIDGIEKVPDGKITLSKNQDGTSSGRIKLKHGQKITIKNLPEGTSYEVIEVGANTDDYMTTSTNERGVLDKDQITRYNNLKRTVELEFTKVKNENIEEPIRGTKFRLYRLICKDETHQEEHNKIIDINNMGTCWELYEEVISDENGKVKLEELLPKEEYRLVEVETAEGRIKPDGQWKIVYNTYEGEAEITAIAGKKMPPAFIKQENGELLLPNMAIYEIPLSGSTGTKTFTEIGMGMITIGLSLIYFGNSKKRKEE